MRTSWVAGRSPLRLRALVLCVPALVLLGCDGPVGPGDREGVSFAYRGALEGSFRVGASAPSFSVEGVPLFEDFTLAAAGDSLGGVVISGFRVRMADSGDLFVLQLVERRTGEFSCGPAGPCHGRLLFDIPDHGGLPPGPAGRYFEIVSGRVDVRQADGGRIAGTFEFTARDEGGSGGAELVVEDGRFDLPLASASMGISVLCFGSRAAGGEC